MKARNPVLWQGQVVGHTSELRGEMFHVYGPWELAVGPAADEFMCRLKAGEELQVTIVAWGRERTGTVGEMSIEDGEIDVLCRPGLPGTV